MGVFLLLLIVLFVFMPLTVLMILAIVLIANRVSKKNRPADHYSADSDSMAYQRPSRPPAQRTGFMPWFITGLAFVIGIGVIAVGLLTFHQPRMVEAQVNEYPLPRASSRLTQAESQAANIEMYHDAVKAMNGPKPELIDVPIDVPVEDPKATEKQAENTPAEKSLDDKANADDKAIAELDAELEGSGASLILESILSAAMKSIQNDTPEEIADKVNQLAADNGSEAPEVDAKDVKKPVSAFQSLTRALLTELPENMDENTALKSLGSFLGRAIAVESVPRPAWVDQPTGVDPKTKVYRSVVTVGPYQTRMECDRHLDDELRNTVNNYAELYFGTAAQGRTDLSHGQLHELIHREHQESINTSVGPMVNVHVEMLFDNKTKAILQEQFHNSLVQERITWSLIALGCVSLFLLVAFAVLKFEPLYDRRVKIAVGVSVVFLLGLGILVLA